MINVTRLDQELKAAGLPITGISVQDQQTPASSPVTYYQRAEGIVRVVWETIPTVPQDASAAVVVAAHDGTPTANEKMDVVNLQARVLAALAVRASTTTTAGQKTQAQVIIDDAAAKVIAAIS